MLNISNLHLLNISALVRSSCTFLMATMVSVVLSLALYTVANWGKYTVSIISRFTAAGVNVDYQQHSTTQQGFVDISNQFTCQHVIMLPGEQVRARPRGTETEIKTAVSDVSRYLPDPRQGNPTSRIVWFWTSHQTPLLLTLHEDRLPALLKVHGYQFRVKGSFKLSNISTSRLNVFNT